MKDSCCSTKACFWGGCRPNLVRVVAGIIMITAGITKFIGGTQALGFFWGLALGIFGISEGGFATTAVVLGGIAATIEVLWGLSFALGCRKISSYASLGLAIVMGVALLTKLTHLGPISGTGFDKFVSVLTTIRLDLLLFALFAQKSMSVFNSKKSCCGSGMCGKK